MCMRWLVVAVLVAGCAFSRGEGEWRPIHHALQEKNEVELAMAGVSRQYRERALASPRYDALLRRYADWAVAQAELTAATETWKTTPGPASDQALKSALELTRLSGDAFLKAVRQK